MNTYRNSILSPLKQEKTFKIVYISRIKQIFSARIQSIAKLDCALIRTKIGIVCRSPFHLSLFSLPFYGLLFLYFHVSFHLFVFVWICICFSFFTNESSPKQLTIQMKMWISVSLSFALSFITMNELCHFAKITCPLASGCSELILYWIGFNQGPGISTFQFQYKRRPTLRWMAVCMFAIQSVKWF